MCSNLNMTYVTPLFRISWQFLISKLLGTAWHTRTSVICFQYIHQPHHSGSASHSDLATVNCFWSLNKPTCVTFHVFSHSASSNEMPGAPGEPLLIFQDSAQSPSSLWDVFWLYTLVKLIVPFSTFLQFPENTSRKAPYCTYLFTWL